MANRSFWIPLNITLSSNGTGQLSYRNSAGQTITITQILQKTTGACNIVGIRNSNGDNLTTALPNSPLDINAFCDLAADNNVPANIPFPIVLQSNEQITFDLVDTSASSNAVQLVLGGKLEQG